MGVEATLVSGFAELPGRDEVASVIVAPADRGSRDEPKTSGAT
jgi:hypothetical protein